MLESEEFGDAFLPTPSVLEGFSSARAAKEFSLRILLLKVFGTRRLGGTGLEGSVAIFCNWSADKIFVLAYARI